MSLTKFKTKPKDIKIIVVGNSGTGKTSFCHKWIKNDFSELYKATIMSEFSYKIYEYNRNFYKVQLWDLAGQDKNINVTKIFSKNSHGCLIFSDATNQISLKETLKWKEVIDSESSFVDGRPLPCLLIQNKIDLVDTEQLPYDSTLTEFAKNNRFIQGIKTSVKEGTGMNEAMNTIIQDIVRRLDEMNNGVLSDEGKSEFSSIKDKIAFTSPEERSRCC